MDNPRATRLVERSLGCYPARWRRRHGDEAAELAALLIRDGASAGSIALSYLAGRGAGMAHAAPGRAPQHRRLRTAHRFLLARRLGRAAGLVRTGQGGRHAHAGQGQHEPAAPKRALPPWLSRAGARSDPCDGPTVDDHLGSRT
jgi:hypothetical protein